jgi:hypothetical protein
MDSYVDGWKSYWKLVTDVARDPSTLQTAQKEYLNHMAQTAPRHFSNTFRAGVQVCGAIVESSGQLASRLYSQTAQDLRDATNGASKAADAFVRDAQAGPVSPSEFTFEGHADETLSRKFLVSNRSAQPTAVALEVSSFSPDPGDAAPTVHLVPQAFSLEANEEKVVECRVTIPAALNPMVEFRASLSAPGALSLTMGLVVKSLGPREVVVEDAPTA